MLGILEQVFSLFLKFFIIISINTLISIVASFVNYFLTSFNVLLEIFVFLEFNFCFFLVSFFFLSKLFLNNFMLSIKFISNNFLDRLVSVFFLYETIKGFKIEEK